jgi:protein AbiQ
MIIAKIQQDFFTQNSDLLEILDKGDARGYGIAVVSIGDGLKFGIPLRSNMRHKSGFKTVDTKGLDYSKAILIDDDSHIGSTFRIPTNEYKQIQDREHFITSKFQKYVDKYIKSFQKNDANALKSYQFSTLQNYHVELGCNIPDTGVQ